MAGVQRMSSAGPDQVMDRLGSIGFEVERYDMRFEVEHDSIEDYLRYRDAFGAPRDLSAAGAIAYRQTLRADLMRRYHDRPVRLGWNVTFLMATLGLPKPRRFPV